MSDARILEGDCRELMRGLPAASVDALVTDPPYGLSLSRSGVTTGDDGPCFDALVCQFAVEALRVTKPGARLVAFGAPRTYHRLVCAVEGAGWVVQDTLCWLYGSGFPKSKTTLKPAWEPTPAQPVQFDLVLARNRDPHGRGGRLVGAQAARLPHGQPGPALRAGDDFLHR